MNRFVTTLLECFWKFTEIKKKMYYFFLSEPLKQTSSVNLDQKDKEGRTALHYVAQTHSEGTFDNGEIASLLIQNGCGLLRNKKGFSAHQEALQSGAASVARLLKAKFKLSSEKSKVINYSQHCLNVIYLT